MEKFIIRHEKKTDCAEASTSGSISTVKVTSQNSDRRDVSPLESSDSSIDIETESECSNIGKKRKKMYKQKYRKEWKAIFGNWVQPSGETGTKCAACNKEITGGISHVRRHSQRPSHLAKLKKDKDTPLISNFLKNDEEFKLKNNVKIAEYKLVSFVAEHNLPIIIMDHLPQLIKSVCPDSKIAQNIKCCRTKSSHLITDCLAVESKEEIVRRISTKHFSLIIDETTDIGTEKSLAIVVRFFDEEEGRVRDAFFGLIKLKDSSAESIYKTIITYLENHKLHVSNLLGFAADNASVMMGNIKGVQARFREILPNIVVMGCVCHSLHLCASAAAKKLPKSIEEFVRGIYNYFHSSSKRIEELQEFQNFCKIKASKLLQPSQTRWLSLQAAVDRILINWEPLKLYFTNAALTDHLKGSEILLENLKSPIYKVYLFFLSYILEIVNKMNLEFQSEDSKLPKLLERISEIFKSILKCFLKREHINQVSLTEVNIKNPRNLLPLENMYFGAKATLLISDETIQIDSKDIHNFKLYALQFYQELSEQIKNRFNFSDPVLNFVSNFSPSIVSSGKVMSIVKPVSDLFSHVIPYSEFEALDSEWREISEIENIKEQGNLLNFTDFWSLIFKHKPHYEQDISFPILSKLVKAIMSLPHSSAAAERVFSELNLNKTKTRNRLHVETCDALLATKELLNKKLCYTWEPPKTLLQKKPRYTE